MAPPILLKVGETEAKRTHADVLNSFFGAHLAPRGHRRVFYPLKTDAAQVWFPVFCEEASVDARVMERFKKTGWANVLSENGTRLTETLLAREDDTSDRARMARKLETLEKYPTLIVFGHDIGGKTEGYRFLGCFRHVRESGAEGDAKPFTLVYERVSETYEAKA